MLLKDRNIIVTGAAQGIGAGIARTLTAHGANVCIVDLQEEALLTQARDLGALPISADISTETGISTVVETVVKERGGIDAIVNNAAPGRDKKVVGELTDTDWEPHADVVLRAVIGLTNEARPHMRPGSSIVNISSIVGSAIAEDQCSLSYHMSKAGLDHLTRYLACHLGPSGIRVNGIAPGLVQRTNAPLHADHPSMAKVMESTIPLGRAGTDSDIGDAAAFLCSDLSHYISGQLLTVDGGLGAREVLGAAIRMTRYLDNPLVEFSGSTIKRSK